MDLKTILGSTTSRKSKGAACRAKKGESSGAMVRAGIFWDFMVI